MSGDLWPNPGINLAEVIAGGLWRKVLEERMATFARARASGETGEARVVADFNAWVRYSIPAYARLDAIGNVDRLPITTKRDHRDESARHVSTDYRPDHAWHKTSSGSQGLPLTVRYSTPFHLETAALAVPKVLARRGLTHHAKRTLYCLTLRDKPGEEPIVRFDPTGRTGPTVRIGVDTANPSMLVRAIEWAADKEPFALATSPAVLAVIDSAISRRLARQLALAAIISSGSSLDEDQRRRSEDLFSAPVVIAYGLSEVGVVASECVDGRLHLNGSDCYAELLKADGSCAAASGTGELVISSTINRFEPFLRYRTGDDATVESNGCTCGEPSMVIRSLHGRVTPLFLLPDGRPLSPTQFRDTFAIFQWVREFQVTQERRDLVRVRFEPAAEISDAEQSSFQRHFADRLPSVEVLLERYKFDTAAKFERYRSLLA